MRPFRKNVWVWALLVIVGVGLAWSLPPVRTEYHKWRLQSLKEKRSRYMSKGLSGMDKFWLQVTGKPVSLDKNIQAHEDALVRRGFLDREAFEVQSDSNRAEAGQVLLSLRSECPWYHAHTLSGTNFIVTACPGMMERWRKRAQEFGWRSRGKC